MYAETMKMELVVVEALKTVMKSNASEPTAAETTKKELVQTLRELSQEIYDLVFDLSASNLEIGILEREIETLTTSELIADQTRAGKVRTEVRNLSQRLKSASPEMQKAYRAAFYRTKKELDRLELSIKKTVSESGIVAKENELKAKFDERRSLVKSLNEKNGMKKQIKEILDTPELLAQAVFENSLASGNA